jgi:hypothetical protein
MVAALDVPHYSAVGCHSNRIFELQLAIFLRGERHRVWQCTKYIRTRKDLWRCEARVKSSVLTFGNHRKPKIGPWFVDGVNTTKFLTRTSEDGDIVCIWNISVWLSLGYLAWAAPLRCCNMKSATHCLCLPALRDSAAEELFFYALPIRLPR